MTAVANASMHGHGGHGHGHGSSAPGHGEGGPASKMIVVTYGFWIFLLSDIIMFASVFAAYAVAVSATAGGPTGRELFEIDRVALETGCLLISSLTCGFSHVATTLRSMAWTQIALAVTLLFGAAFLGLELVEFQAMIAEGNGPGRSAFLSAFFMLVGMHGLHVFVGLLWLMTMMAQLVAKGFRANVLRRLFCFNLFWHALDIVWIGVFSIVYLMGVVP